MRSTLDQSDARLLCIAFFVFFCAVSIDAQSAPKPRSNDAYEGTKKIFLRIDSSSRIFKPGEPIEINISVLNNANIPQEVLLDNIYESLDIEITTVSGRIVPLDMASSGKSSEQISNEDFREQVKKLKTYSGGGQSCFNLALPSQLRKIYRIIAPPRTKPVVT